MTRMLPQLLLILTTGCTVTGSAYVEHRYYLPDQEEPIAAGANISWSNQPNHSVLPTLSSNTP